MAIRYKVVLEKNRKSCMAERKGMRGYILTYKKGKTVKAIEGSIGILVFKTREQAENWMKLPMRTTKTTILRVETNSRGKTPKNLFIIDWRVTNSLKEDYYDYKTPNNSRLRWNTPIGTLAYPEVKVLD